MRDFIDKREKKSLELSKDPWCIGEVVHELLCIIVEKGSLDIDLATEKMIVSETYIINKKD